MRSCAWIGNSNPCIMHDSMLLTILSMSVYYGICFLKMDNSVSAGTSAWGICVYSTSEGLMVLTVSKNQDVSLIIIVKLSVLVLMGMIELAKGNIFLSLDWIYSSVYFP